MSKTKKKAPELVVNINHQYQGMWMNEYSKHQPVTRWRPLRQWKVNPDYYESVPAYLTGPAKAEDGKLFTWTVHKDWFAQAIDLGE